MEKQISKVWGSERWIENDERYCLKLLTLSVGYQSSMHYHRVKRETFLCVAGKVKLEIMPKFRMEKDTTVHKIYLRPYQAYTLEPWTPHRFTAVGGEAIIVEASTKHDDEDVVRLEESKPVGS